MLIEGYSSATLVNICLVQEKLLFWRNRHSFQNTKQAVGLAKPLSREAFYHLVRVLAIDYVTDSELKYSFRRKFSLQETSSHQILWLLDVLV